MLTSVINHPDFSEMGVDSVPATVRVVIDELRATQVVPGRPTSRGQSP